MSEVSQRERMVEHQLRARGIHDESVLAAMRKVPRHAFVPEESAPLAYKDRPLPIGEGQTISQPFIVARMTELLRLRPGDRVLELGTGSGYQTAILAEMGAKVWTIERSASLGQSAQSRVRQLGYAEIAWTLGDGTLGLPPMSPFDRILATGSLPHISTTLLAQLAPGGLFVGPIGELASQILTRITYHSDGPATETFGGCRFVPLVGDGGWSQSSLRSLI